MNARIRARIISRREDRAEQLWTYSWGIGRLQVAGRLGGMDVGTSPGLSRGTAPATHSPSRSWLGRLWRLVPGRVRRFGVRLLEPTYTLTAGVVVVDVSGRVLLARHVFRVGSGWGIPGGFVERGEQPEDAARRELREELGLEVEDLRLAFVRTLRRARQVETIFVGRAARDMADGEIGPLEREIAEVAWFDPKVFPDVVSADQQGIVRRALSEVMAGVRD